MDRLRFGVRKARDYTHAAELPAPPRPPAQVASRRAPMFCFAAMSPRIAGKHFENRDLQTPRKVIACRRRRTRCRGRRARCARATTSAAISCWSRIGKGGMAEVFRAIAQRRAGVRARVRHQAHPPRQLRLAEVRADVLRGGADLGAAASPEHRAGLRLRSDRRRVLHGDGASRRHGSVDGDARAARAGRRDAAVAGGVRGARGGARPSPRAHAGASRRRAGRASSTATSRPPTSCC